MNLEQRGEIADLLARAYHHGTQDLADLPELVVTLVDTDAWQERIVPQTGEPAEFQTFEAYVAAPPVEGLGADIESLKKLCAGHKRATDAITRATQRPVGRPRGSVPGVTEEETGNNVPKSRRPEGNSAAKALRRLRRDRPDLHARVLDGELSPHAAAVEAGFRRRTISVPVDRPEQVAATLRRHLKPEALAQLRELLAEELVE